MLCRKEPLPRYSLYYSHPSSAVVLYYKPPPPLSRIEIPEYGPSHRERKTSKHSLSSVEIYSRMCSAALISEAKVLKVLRLEVSVWIYSTIYGEEGMVFYQVFLLSPLQGTLVGYNEFDFF
jgi:hypothetical protein